MPAAPTALETLLRVRQLRRDACRLALADLERRASELDSQRAAIEFDRKADLAALRDRESSGTLEVRGIAASRRHLQQLATELELVRSSKGDLTRQIEQQRDRLLRCDREARSLEKLLESRLTEAIASRRRSETRELDEAARPASACFGRVS